jgi:hypothetical protein
MARQAMHQAAYFHLSFAPNIKLVTTVRRFTGEFYRRILPDQEVASRLALATHELLENAVAYASDGETGVRIELDSPNLIVRTWNRVSSPHLQDLTNAIDELNRAPDADAYYQQMLAKSAVRTEGSGLGLARVRAEAQMAVSYEIVADRVCVIAQTQIQPGGAS